MIAEERRNINKAVKLLILTVGVGGVLLFYGIPILARFTAFVSDLGKSNKQITQNDKTPPPPPTFDSFPDFTNQKNINLTGNGESGSTIKLFFNGNSLENVADKSGKFTFNLNLTNGENVFSGISVDQSGNESQKTQDFKINFDNKPADLSVNSPKDGSQFFGASQRQTTIDGKTEQNSLVTINDRTIAVGEDGGFQFTTSLSEGENKFNIKSTDQAGNTSEINLTFTYSL